MNIYKNVSDSKSFLGTCVTLVATDAALSLLCGPVGMGLAIDLGLRGVNCVVVERHLNPQPIPKGQNLTQRTMEHFFFWNAEPELRAARTIPREYGINGMTTYGTLLGEYKHDWLQLELVRPFYFTDNERLPQYATEAVLRRRASAIPPITTLYEWTCTTTRKMMGVWKSTSSRAQETDRLFAEIKWSDVTVVSRSFDSSPV